MTWDAISVKDILQTALEPSWLKHNGIDVDWGKEQSAWFRDLEHYFPQKEKEEK
ncbi:hypothetical protein HY947_03915 [Candidatus Gottesmanbacteria bacterium]|nr:hypothetical protein [Candidatus Gottesmanbacteria bacterium]